MYPATGTPGGFCCVAPLYNLFFRELFTGCIETEQLPVKALAKN